MNIKIVFNDNSTKQITYTGNWSFAKWSGYFFSKRYYVLSDNNDVGNLTIDTDKVKYIEIVK